MSEPSKTDKYVSKDVAIIIPTRNRPVQIRRVLESLGEQSLPCGRVIVVASGDSVEDIVMGFRDHLPVEYHECDTPGQIHQKNQGVSLIESGTPLVGFLDDDIVLEPLALQRMVELWNCCESNTAGISFNIINNPPHKYSLARRLVGMGSRRQGRVLSSGYNVSISAVSQDLRTQWLCGGATVWRAEILRRFIPKEIKTRWAICEDVIYSYPISKEYPLYVCADARVRHEHVYDHAVKMKYRYYGRTISLWRLYFVELNAELMRSSFLWMSFCQIVARFSFGIISLRARHIQYALGQLEGVLTGMMAIVRDVDLSKCINEDQAHSG